MMLKRNGGISGKCRQRADVPTNLTVTVVAHFPEPHADIIVKGSRDVDYGHNLNLTTGRSGLILDLVIEAGNPADSERLVPMLELTGAPRRGRRPPMAASPAATISSRQRLAASATWRSTRRAA
jgi:IS5 family transposase